MICVAWFLCDDDSTSCIHCNSSQNNVQRLWYMCTFQSETLSSWGEQTISERNVYVAVFGALLSMVLPVRTHTAPDQIGLVVHWPQPSKHISLRCGMHVIMSDRPAETFHCECVWLLGEQEQEEADVVKSHNEQRGRTTEWQRTWWPKWRADSFSELPGY